MNMISATSPTILTAILTGFCLTAVAAEFNTDNNGALVHGYDLVSYFDGTPQKGRKNIVFESDGYKLFFASEENRNRYRKNPDYYTPKFGAYCSYGVRMGKKLDIDPQVWAIHDDRLYFLLDRSTKMIWDNDRSRNIGIAERLWPKIRPVSAKALEDS